MKTTVLALALLFSAFPGFPQGRLILGNDSNHLFVLGDTLPADAAFGGGNGTVGNTTGAIPISPLPSGVTLAVALFVGPTSAALALQTVIPLDATGWLSPGRMRDFNLPSLFPVGAPFFCDLVVHDSAFTPASGLRLGASYYGESGTFWVNGTPLPGIVRLDNYWPEGNLVINVPEPEVYVLPAVLALGLGLGRHRQLRQQAICARPPNEVVA
jgi:hypothetical protein